MRTPWPSLIAPADLDWLCALAAASPPGDLVECGVYQGGSAARLHEVAEEQGRRLWLFDTFAGHPRIDLAHDLPQHHAVGRFHDAIDPGELAAALPRAQVVVGEVPGTFDVLEGAAIAFVHADMDLHAPTAAVCRELPRHMVPGGLLYFDDYGFDDCPGVKTAVDAAFGLGRVLPNARRLVVWGGAR